MSKPVGASDLIKAVEETLLAPHSLSRGIYRESGLRRLVADTTRGHADHSYLLQVLLILELWQQQFHDKEAEFKAALQNGVESKGAA